MLYTALLISLASLGFRSITSKGMILYFLRKPFDSTTSKTIKYLGKPLLLCATCMSSVHTLVWYPILTGEYSWKIIPIMLVVAFLNAFLQNLLEIMWQKNLFK